MSEAMFNLDYAREVACQAEDVELLARLLLSAVEHVVLLHADIERLQLENNQLHTECGHLQATVAEVQQARIDAAVEGSDYKAKWNAWVTSWAQAVVTALVTGDVASGSLLHHKLRDVVIEYRAAAQAAEGGSDGQ